MKNLVWGFPQAYWLIVLFRPRTNQHRYRILELLSKLGLDPIEGTLVAYDYFALAGVNSRLFGVFKAHHAGF